MTSVLLHIRKLLVRNVYSVWLQNLKSAEIHYFFNIEYELLTVESSCFVLNELDRGNTTTTQKIGLGYVILLLILSKWGSLLEVKSSLRLIGGWELKRAIMHLFLWVADILDDVLIIKRLVHFFLPYIICVKSVNLESTDIRKFSR